MKKKTILRRQGTQRQGTLRQGTLRARNNTELIPRSCL